MSSSTWTPDALLSEARPSLGEDWRPVGARHRVSTLPIVDSLAEQEPLEDILEKTKPSVPLECRRLDYLLSTPFRYGAAYPAGSRFRRAGKILGVFYAAETPDTAVAEMVFNRFLFCAESPDTPWPDGTTEYKDADAWADLIDHSACQHLADRAREAAIEIIRYQSIRDPGGEASLAALTCRAFAEAGPV